MSSVIIKYLNEVFVPKLYEINDWFQQKSLSQHLHIYNSIDLRHSGFKIAPVDHNLFPAGFNNLNAIGLKKATLYMEEYIEKCYGQIKNILLIIELHTRNVNYIENVLNIVKIFQGFGINIRLSVIPEYVSDTEIDQLIKIYQEKAVVFENIIREKDLLQTESGFVPDLVVLNNDLTQGLPKILEGISQPITPGISYGWYSRRKSGYCIKYKEVIKEFATEFGIEEFFIEAQTELVRDVNFKTHQGVDILRSKALEMLSDLKKKYKFFNSELDPYLYIKADNGTYGMAIMIIKDESDIDKVLMSVNKKNRNKMSTLKGGKETSDFIIQEGIRTIDQYSSQNSEDLLYFVGGRLVNIIKRYHPQSDDQGNLNSIGGQFIAIDHEKDDAYLAHEIIGRLSVLAASKENY